MTVSLGRHKSLVERCTIVHVGAVKRIEMSSPSMPIQFVGHTFTLPNGYKVTNVLLPWVRIVFF